MIKIIIVLILIMPVSVFAGEMDELIDRQIEEGVVGNLQQQLDKVKNKDFEDIIPSFNVKDMTRSLASGGWSWDVSVILKRAFAFYCKELFISIKMMISLLALAFACALGDNLQKSFGDGSVGRTAFYISFFLTASVAVNAFMNSVSLASDTLDNAVIFVNALIPATLAFLAGGGATVSAGVFHRVMMLSVDVVSLCVKNIIFPFILISAALSAAGCVSEKNTVNRLSKLFSNIAKWLLGILITVFIAVITMQSLAAPALDGIATKTAKYAMGVFVPVIGSVLSETLDLVFGSCVILKNAVGVTGLVAVLAICCAPLIRLAAQATMFSLAAAAIEPVADQRMMDMLSKIGESVMLVFVILLVVILMFIVNLAVIISAGNTAAVLGR